MGAFDRLPFLFLEVECSGKRYFLYFFQYLRIRRETPGRGATGCFEGSINN